MAMRPPLFSNGLPVKVTLANMRDYIATAPPLSSPHKDGWRVEHLVPLAADSTCGEALAAFMTTIARGDVSNKIADLLSSATLVILLKKDAETMDAMKETLGPAYVQPQLPLDMGIKPSKHRVEMRPSHAQRLSWSRRGPFQILGGDQGGLRLNSMGPTYGYGVQRLHSCMYPETLKPPHPLETHEAPIHQPRWTGRHDRGPPKERMRTNNIASRPTRTGTRRRSPPKIPEQYLRRGPAGAELPR